MSKTYRIIKKLSVEKLINIKVYGKSYILTVNFKNPLLKYKLLEEEAKYTQKALKKYPYLGKLKLKGDVVLVFGSHADFTADELSDIDILTINGKEGHFNLSWDEFYKLLKEKNPTLRSIIKKHIIFKGFEKFIDEVIKWMSSSGV